LKKMESDWIDLLDNSKEIRGTFGRNQISLKQLRLWKFEMIWGREIKLFLIAEKIPETVPERWKKQAFDGVLFELSAAISSLRLEIPEEFINGAPLMQIEFQKGKVIIFDSANQKTPFLTLDAWSINLHAEPINRASLAS
jgi:hypothetical protein